MPRPALPTAGFIELTKPKQPPPQRGPDPASKCPTGDRACQFCASMPGQLGVFPDTANGCSGFFNCGNGGNSLVLCAPGTLFSPALGYCDWAPSVVCPAQLTVVNLHVPAPIAARGVTARRALRKALARARRKNVGNRLVGGF